MPTIISKDSLRTSVEAATGGFGYCALRRCRYPNLSYPPENSYQDVYPDLGLSGTPPHLSWTGWRRASFTSACIPPPLSGAWPCRCPGWTWRVRVL
jgi:hypothetical protein